MVLYFQSPKPILDTLLSLGRVMYQPCFWKNMAFRASTATDKQLIQDKLRP